MKRILFFILSVLLMSTGIAAASANPAAESIRDDFYQSVNYNPSEGLLTFTIPEKVPEGYRFYLHVSGRMYMGNKSDIMSFHAFDEETQKSSWISGKTYPYPLKADSLVECLLVFGLIDQHHQEFLYSVHVLPDGTKYMD